MFAPGKVELRVAGRVLDSATFSDSHEAEDIARRFRDQSPDGRIMVTFEGKEPEIWVGAS
jgi:hypothetical protein